MTFLWGTLGLFVGFYLGLQALGTPIALASGGLLLAACIGPMDWLTWSARGFVAVVGAYLIVTAVAQGLAD